MMQTNNSIVCLLACLALATLGPAGASQLKVTPVQKVIQLLQGMVEKGKKEKHEEQAQYAAYNQFCQDKSAEKDRSIEEAAQAIEKLTADIEKYTSDTAALAAEIATHEKDIAMWTGDNKAATKVREIEHADYVALHKDYEESLDALSRAIDYLKQRAADIPQASADAEFLQQVYRIIPEEGKRQIEAFLATDPSVSAEDADSHAVSGGTTATGLLDVSKTKGHAAQPEAAAYEFQSQGIIDMLEKLKDKFQNEMDKVMQEETESKNAYDLLIQDLRDQVNQATESVAMKSRIKSDKLEAKAVAEGDLTETQAAMADDKKYKADLEATCTQKASDFEARQTLRAEEIQAIEKAIEILSGEAVSGAAEEHLPGLLQKGTATALVQLRSTLRSPNQLRVSAYLKEKGERLNSRVLSTLAVAASEDPFAKVKQLIQNLITKLMAEASEEAEHKGWCDEELATNEQTRKKKTEQTEVLSSEIDELNASIAQLTTEIGDLSKQVADLDVAIAEATKMREEEKAKNTDTIKDAKEAQTAVAQALEVLQEFYAKAGEATALVQAQKKQPDVFDSPYKGMQDAASGPIGLLEVIQSDFARLESETTAAEAQGAKEYDEFMNDSEVSKAQKKSDIEHKTMKRQNQEQSLQEKTGDLEMTQDELDKALAYYEKLKPSCIDVGESYAERTARRKEEIESLQEALKILTPEGAAA